MENVPALLDQAAEKKTQFIKQLKIRRGIEALACEDVGIEMYQLREWLTSDRLFVERFQDAMYYVKDFVESKLLERIEGTYVFTQKGLVYKEPPNVDAIKTYLNARVRERGYGMASKTGAPPAPHHPNINVGVQINGAGVTNGDNSTTSVLSLTADEKKLRLAALSTDELRAVRKAIIALRMPLDVAPEPTRTTKPPADDTPS